MFNKQEFIDYLKQEGRSQNTIKSYTLHIDEYIRWYRDSYDLEFNKLFRENVLQYKSYLINIKKAKGKELNAKTVNAKLAALGALNKFLVEKQIQNEIVVKKEDNIKIQQSIANPSTVDKKEVEQFRQKILEDGNTRLYAIVTLLSYTGLRISECLDLKIEHIDLISKQLVVKNGKGQKQRIVYFNDKVVNALKQYLKGKNREASNYLFNSRQAERLNRTIINREFKRYSKKITPHTLRHFYCSFLLENGFTVAEVANMAGHRSVNTTLIYTNPSIKSMKDKLELL